MINSLVYVVEDLQGNHKTNSDTGSKIYTVKHNACRLCKRNKDTSVVEYQLVPTGNVYDRNGDLISLEDLDID